MDKDDAGRAFAGYATDGMSLRDYFAGQALIGIVDPVHAGSPATWAYEAYKVADAMLAERAK